jgi:hypothetical protein
VKITRGREVRVNLGNFEHVITSASVETELGENERWPVAEELDLQLDKLLSKDLRDARASTSLDENESFIYTWLELKGR